MTQPNPTALAADERAALKDIATCELNALREQREELDDQMRPLRDLLDEIRVLDNTALIAGRTPQDFFTDAEFRTRVYTREYDYGRGDQTLSDYMEAAFRGLAPSGEFFSFARDVNDDHECTAIYPHIALRHGQDITDVAAVLRRVHPVLAVDGVMRVELLGVSGDDAPEYRYFEMPDLNTATLRGYLPHITHSGPLEEILTWVTEHKYC